jgi:phospholipase/carboxylesterase
VRRRFHLILLLFALVASLGALWLLLLGARPEKPRLTTLVHGDRGPTTVVLLHGYGSSADKWMPFTQTLRIPGGGRFYFPQGPENTVPPDGPVDGRAWWRLNLGAFVRPGQPLPDLSQSAPPGIKSASTLVVDLLRYVDQTSHGRVVLGGFSQGAMLASEVAFMTDATVHALVLLSVTPVNEAAWQRGFARRRGLPVFMAHGRTDNVLSFALAERLRDQLRTAGLSVVWIPFADGHEIPAEVVTALNTFLAQTVTN